MGSVGAGKAESPSIHDSVLQRKDEKWQRYIPFNRQSVETLSTVEASIPPERGTRPQVIVKQVVVEQRTEGPNPSTAKISAMPQLTQEQKIVLRQQRPLKADRKNRGVALECFFLTDQRMWYEGEWSRGVPNGQGRLYLWNGIYYEGEFNGGDAECSDGLAVFPDGSYLRGNIRNSKAQGTATYYNAHEGLTYTGQWVDSRPHGRGKEIFRDGSHYEGLFRDGHKQGRGKYSWKNGMSYEGDFKKGYMWGSGRLCKGRGNYEGEFEKDLKVGQSVKMVTQTGTYEGPLKNGLMHGQGKFVWSDQKKYTGEFQNGQLSGRGEVQYPNGQIALGVWDRGLNIKIDKLRSRT